MDAKEREVKAMEEKTPGWVSVVSTVRVLKDEEVKRCVVSRGKQGWEFRVERRHGAAIVSDGWPTAAAATGVLGLFLRTGWLTEKTPRGAR